MPYQEISRPTPEELALGYPRKWTESELRAMSPETAARFIPPQARRVYRDTPSNFLFEAYPLERDPAIHVNHEMARQLITNSIYTSVRTGNFLFLTLSGPMAGGKSTIVYDTIQHINSGEGFPLTLDLTYALFKHAEQVKFDGARIVTHGERSIPEAIPYEGSFDILGQIDDKKSPDIVFVEEAQFAFTDRARSEEAIRREIGGFLREAEAMGIKVVVFTSLDFDFRAEPWPHMTPMLEQSHQHFVLAARCEGCGGIAYLTQRDVFEDDFWRPARYDEPRVAVGNVGEDGKPRNERYQPKCMFCHQVLPPLNP